MIREAAFRAEALAVEQGRQSLGSVVGRRVVARSSCASTQEVARALLAEGAAHGTVVWAEEQTAGRGRGGRPWVSGWHGLWCSVIVRPDLDVRHASRLTGLTAVGLVDGLRGLGLSPRIKWPNDVVFPTDREGPLGRWRKAGGILTELVDAAPVTAIVGFGVNLTAPKGGWPEELEGRATDLVAEGLEVDRRTALGTLLEGLEGWLVGPFDDELWRAALERLRESSSLLGEEVTLLDEGLTGRAVGLDEDGALLVDVAGDVRRVVAGDVVTGAAVATEGPPAAPPSGDVAAS